MNYFTEKKAKKMLLDYMNADIIKPSELIHDK